MFRHMEAFKHYLAWGAWSLLSLPLSSLSQSIPITALPRVMVMTPVTHARKPISQGVSDLTEVETLAVQMEAS